MDAIDRDRADDVATIERIIGDVETGFNTKDVELAVRHFADDATATSATGVRVTGREALVEAHRTGFAGFLKDQYARYTIAGITFLRPDVALVHKEARATTPEGDLVDPDHSMVALYVMVKDGHRWRIAARANTLVPH
ncbi:MAG TPA: SgcJ/EcaC family oxidoreductase [Acidimicrobiales bacterium]|nr:SgcJ/EcaC family oxidoreductase [Acidimicrobiales bacterium]